MVTRLYPIGSTEWLVNERANAIDRENEDALGFSIAVKEELNWLNEHMAGIFEAGQLDVAEILKTPARLRGRTPRTVRRPLQNGLGPIREPLVDVFANNNSPANKQIKPTQSNTFEFKLPRKDVKANQSAKFAILPDQTATSSQTSSAEIICMLRDSLEENDSSLDTTQASFSTAHFTGKSPERPRAPKSALNLSPARTQEPALELDDPTIASYHTAHEHVVNSVIASPTRQIASEQTLMHNLSPNKATRESPPKKRDASPVKHVDESGEPRRSGRLATKESMSAKKRASTKQRDHRQSSPSKPNRAAVEAEPKRPELDATPREILEASISDTVMPVAQSPLPRLGKKVVSPSPTSSSSESEAPLVRPSLNFASLPSRPLTNKKRSVGPMQSGKLERAREHANGTKPIWERDASHGKSLGGSKLPNDGEAAETDDNKESEDETQDKMSEAQMQHNRKQTLHLQSMIQKLASTQQKPRNTADVSRSSVAVQPQINDDDWIPKPKTPKDGPDAKQRPPIVKSKTEDNLSAAQIHREVPAGPRIFSGQSPPKPKTSPFKGPPQIPQRTTSLKSNASVTSAASASSATFITSPAKQPRVVSPSRPIALTSSKSQPQLASQRIPSSPLKSDGTLSAAKAKAKNMFRKAEEIFMKSSTTIDKARVDSATSPSPGKVNTKFFEAAVSNWETIPSPPPYENTGRVVSHVRGIEETIKTKTPATAIKPSQAELFPDLATASKRDDGNIQAEASAERGRPRAIQPSATKEQEQRLREQREHEWASQAPKGISRQELEAIGKEAAAVRQTQPMPASEQQPLRRTPRKTKAALDRDLHDQQGALADDERRQALETARLARQPSQPLRSEAEEPDAEQEIAVRAPQQSGTSRLQQKVSTQSLKDGKKPVRQPNNIAKPKPAPPATIQIKVKTLRNDQTRKMQHVPSSSTLTAAMQNTFDPKPQQQQQQPAGNKDSLSQSTASTMQGSVGRAAGLKGKTVPALERAKEAKLKAQQEIERKELRKEQVKHEMLKNKQQRQEEVRKNAPSQLAGTVRKAPEREDEDAKRRKKEPTPTGQAPTLKHMPSYKNLQKPHDEILRKPVPQQEQETNTLSKSTTGPNPFAPKAGPKRMYQPDGQDYRAPPKGNQYQPAAETKRRRTGEYDEPRSPPQSYAQPPQRQQASHYGKNTISLVKPATQKPLFPPSNGASNHGHALSNSQTLARVATINQTVTKVHAGVPQVEGVHISTDEIRFQQKTPKTLSKALLNKSSPQYVNGEDIELESIHSDSEDDDDDGGDNFSAPSWTDKEPLAKTLAQQEDLDVEYIFGPMPPLNMDEIFRNAKGANRFKNRSSSANWNGADKLTLQEVEADKEARLKLQKTGKWTHDIASAFKEL